MIRLSRQVLAKKNSLNVYSKIWNRQFSTTKKTVEEQEQEFTQLRIQSGITDWTRNPESVLVVHPKIRWGKNASPWDDVGLKLEEACTLVKTLPGFTSALYEALNVPVFDRYNLVLWIFKYYARTKEAHLQISLAEIPYIRTRMKHTDMFGESAENLHIGEAHASLTGGRADPTEILRLREQTLRKKVRALSESKANELESRRRVTQKKAIRSLLVAVIGYTNAGKTTLIKSLTGAEEISGENRLFATLDTTLHHAILPSKCSIFLADTIGFISDLPLNLIASFEATLRHVINADLLIHIEDLSHPNIKLQRENVMETLRGLNLREELLDTMIHVSNKVDRLTPEQFNSMKLSLDEKNIPVSCRTGNGLTKLVDVLDQKVQQLSGTKTRIFRLKHGSELITYLYGQGLVSQEPEPIGDTLEFRVKMNDEQFARLKAHMISTGKKISKQ